jgi:urease accessory protein
LEPWHAELDLHFRHQPHGTTLARQHRGPLQIQKPLYPEGRATCHAIMIHPPGGIAGGDTLAIAVRVDPLAQALVTTPGATKWYKAAGRVATQRVRIAVEGALEWLPQEAIVYDAADADSELQIDLGPAAAMIGWDIVALGRRASGERFAQGCFAQSIRLMEAGALQWHERTRIIGADRLLESAVGLRGQHVFGSIWAYGPVWTGAQIDALRVACGAEPGFVPTRLAPRLVVGRALGATTDAVRRVLERFWTCVRPLVMNGRVAQPPRLWAT